MYHRGVLTQTQLRALLDRHALAPRKSLGQNFLIDANLARKLIDASGVGSDDLVLEVGPGAGALTGELLDRGCRVLACELDAGLAGLVEERFGDSPRFNLVRGDCLAGKHALSPSLVSSLGDETFALVANLPYHAATPLVMTLLLDHPACRALWVTVQKEVADRLASAPGSKKYGEISVVAQALATIVPLAPLGPACFWPRPKVTSAMIGLVRRDELGTADAHRLQSLCRRLFTKRRKQLSAILRDEMRDRAWPAGIDPAQRPETLTPAQVESLATCLAVA